MNEAKQNVAKVEAFTCLEDMIREARYKRSYRDREQLLNYYSEKVDEAYLILLKAGVCV